jgi:hypothetical protein
VAVLPGLGADPAFGPTFATSLLVGSDGRLAVSACGIRACRVRVVDPASGAVVRVDGTGEAVALSASELVTRSACDGLPCPLDAVDLGTGARTERTPRPDPSGLEPVVRSSTATSGIEPPAGKDAVAPSGRVTDPATVQFLDHALFGHVAGEVFP